MKKYVMGNMECCGKLISKSIEGTKLYHMFLEKQGAYSIVTGIKTDGSTGKINLPEKIHDIDISQQDIFQKE